MAKTDAKKATTKTEKPAPKRKKDPAKEAAKTSGDDLEAALGTHKASPEDLRAVEDVVKAALYLQTRIKNGEALLKQLNADLNVIVTTQLPDIMARAGTSLYKVDSGDFEGYKVEVVPLIAGSLPRVTKADDDDDKIADKKAKRARGLDWIRKVGLEDIIKTELSILFDKGQDNLMGDIKAKAQELGLDPHIDSDIHHSTLCSAIKEYVKSPDPEIGEPPFEDLGLFAGRVAKLTPPKENK